MLLFGKRAYSDLASHLKRRNPDGLGAEVALWEVIRRERAALGDSDKGVCGGVSIQSRTSQVFSFALSVLLGKFEDFRLQPRKLV